MIYDFHTHTFLSDGALSPLELIRRAKTKGYQVIALTDHAGPGSLERVIREVAEDCRMAREYWDIIAIPGIELTHLPHQAITQAAQRAKQLGAWLVIVHGETTVEPVPEGTNLAAVQSPYVDILAHPGQLTVEEARLAALNEVFVEISARKGHSLSNEHVCSTAQKTGARLLLNSDAHDDEDLLTASGIAAISESIGVAGPGLEQMLSANPIALLKRLPISRL